jgi:hypothetical protein
MLKKCFKCEQELPRTEFYKHPRMGDGLLGKCKECAKSDVRARYALTIEERHAYEAKRNATPERMARLRSAHLLHNKRNPEKARARNAVASALKSRRIARKPCDVCGDTKSQAHHDDYARPLDVRWLCFVHHRIAHGQNPTIR